MQNFIIILTLLLIGMGIKRLPVFPKETGNVLNLIVIYFSYPALILLNIPKLVFSNKLFIPATIPWVMLIFSATLVLLLSKMLKWDRAVTGCLLLLIPLGNTSFLGIPMVRAFLGEQAVPYALVYDQLGSFPALATYGTLILAIYGSGESKPSLKKIGKKIITFPPFIALILAIVLRPFAYPPVVLNFLDMSSATLVPLVMIAVGFQLQLKMDRAVLSQLSVGLAIKLVAAPLLAVLLTRIMGLGGELVQVAIFEAGMPPMVTAGALAILDDLSPSLAAALVGIGILVSFVTLPLLYQLL
ncbi:MAG: AEC family transporter [Anaerolineae bacterium]|jgi:malate permease and related proteins|nr:AEC family transporter [Anaerolineae bacterium]MBT7069367.1 AEC family transporter [Anaerolineae bacterium]MBT7326016.1 AEC family transporter [Anaerolineae bacterium]MBT7602388.1 AEC family transporter [Anaerolineae bacterium]